MGNHCHFYFLVIKPGDSKSTIGEALNNTSIAFEFPIARWPLEVIILTTEIKLAHPHQADQRVALSRGPNPGAISRQMSRGRRRFSTWQMSIPIEPLTSTKFYKFLQIWRSDIDILSTNPA